MRFICEVDRAGNFDEDVSLFTYGAKACKHFLDLDFSTINDLSVKHRNKIPVGSVAFVEKQLAQHGVSRMHPIEVPVVLRTSEFLGRGYCIKKYSDLPKSGYWFIKDVSTLKTFSGTLYIDSFEYNYDVTQQMKEDMWLYSSVLRFAAEYRFYVCDNNIIWYSLYDISEASYINKFPDIAKVQAMIDCYSSTDAPEAYTMDVGVTVTGDTYLIEIHPFACVGLYTTLLGDNLPNMYKKGYSWYLSEYNKPLEEWEFFLNG